MKKLSDLKVVLYNYVKSYEMLNSEYQKLVSNNFLYEEIIKILTDCLTGNYENIVNLGICLETLFGNKYDDLEDYIFKNKKLALLNKTGSNDYKELVGKIFLIFDDIKRNYLESTDKAEKLSDKLDEMKEKMVVSRRVISKLKYKQVVWKDDISIINELLRELGYDNTEVSIVVEKLFIYNKDIRSKKLGISVDNQEKYKFMELFSIGVEMFEYPLVDNEEKIKKYIDSIYLLLEENSDEISLNDIFLLFPTVGKELKDVSELVYIFVGVLEKLRDKLQENINLIKEPEFIMDLEVKNELANDCFYLINLYNVIRNGLDSIVYEEDNTETLDEPILDKVDNVGNNLKYLNNPNGKCYLLSDLESMPFEYISSVVELLEKFKNNLISKKNNKYLTEAGKTFELRGDQVRILYKRNDGNECVVYGAFIKKDTRIPTKIRDNICRRNGYFCDDSASVEKQLEEYVNANGRKWSR